MKRYGLIVVILAVVVLIVTGIIIPASAAPQSGGDSIGNYNFRLEIDGVDAG